MPRGVGLFVVRIEYLNLVPAHENDPAVPAPLAVAGDFDRRGPLHVNLGIAEPLLAHQVAGAANHLDIAIPHFPATSSLRGPLGEVLAIEQTNGVRWRAALRGARR